MSEIWYQTSKYKPTITPVTVERHTQSSVWIGGRRHAQVSEWHRVFPTWEAAKAHLMDRAEQRLENARRALQAAQSEYGNIKGMRPPSSAEAQNG